MEAELASNRPGHTSIMHSSINRGVCAVVLKRALYAVYLNNVKRAETVNVGYVDHKTSGGLVSEVVFPEGSGGVRVVASYVLYEGGIEKGIHGGETNVHIFNNCMV